MTQAMTVEARPASPDPATAATAAVATRSRGPSRSRRGEDVQESDVREDVEKRHESGPKTSALGTLFSASLTSSARKVTLFQASAEKREPTVATAKAQSTARPARTRAPAPRRRCRDGRWRECRRRGGP